jgi:very-short-patch-repair endonuclease
MWAILRAERLNGWKFRRQHPTGRYVVDFARLGWRVIRFWNSDVLNNRKGVTETILMALAER